MQLLIEKFKNKMDINILKQIIIEAQEIIPKIDLIERDIVLEDNGSYVFVGVRQAGKSYMLYQRMQQLLKSGHSIEEIVYINFDDERIFGSKAEELDLILQAHRSLFNVQPILFLDEIQNIDGWEHFARRLANEKYRVYITGSNAKMLSRDIATTLGGRYFMQDIYPFSFEEYLKAKNINLKPHWSLSKKRLDVRREFDTYFKFGGFPELINIVAKRSWLTGMHNKIFFSDVVVRNNIRNEESLRMTIRRLAESVKQPIAYNRISNLIKSVGISANPTTIMDYVKYLKDACLIFSLENYATKLTEKETVKKHYFIDNGILNLFLTDASTSLLENICAIHLYKKYKENLYYYNKNIEVDFYLPEQSMAVQVCYNTSDTQTLEREVYALNKIEEFLSIDKMYIITLDQEKTITSLKGKEIEVVPVWKWLLEKEK